ncbi:MAG: translocation/assembly module TamB domain-containing protein [Burkholderiales bacterium]
MRRALKIFAALVVVLAVAVALVLWLAGRESTLQWLAQIATEASGGRLSVQGVSGSLYGPLAISEIRFEDDNRRVDVRGLRFDWAPEKLLDGRVQATELSAAEIESFTKKKTEEPPPSVPESLALPFTYEIDKAQIKSLVIADAKGRRELNDIAVHLDYDGEIHRAELQSVLFAGGRARGELALEDSAPFPLDGVASVSGNWQEHEYNGKLALSGALAEVQFRASAESGEASAEAEGTANPFSKFPLEGVELKAANVDPSHFRANLPGADLGAAVTLQSEGETLAGDLMIDNAKPGPSDQKLLPLEKASLAFGGSVEALEFKDIEVAFHESGKLVGDGKYERETLHLFLTAQALNLRALHSALQPTSLDGDLAIAASAKMQTLDADLTHEKFRIRVDAEHDDGKIEVSRAELKSGKSELVFNANAELAAPNTFHAEALLKSFNPADFGEFPQARLNATLNAEGKRAPDLSAKLNFTLDDSRWRKVPLRGKGAVTVAGEAVENTKITLQAGANRLDLNGAFGRAGDALRFVLSAPRLGELGAKLRGNAEAQGNLRGTVTQASMDLALKAANLQTPGDVAVNKAQAEIEAQGNLKKPADFSSLKFSAQATNLSAKTAKVGNFQGSGTVKDGVNGKIAMALAAKNVITPQLTLSNARINAGGSRAAHRVNAEAVGSDLLGSDLDFQATVVGNWRDDSWSGKIEKLSNKGRYPLQLLAPAKLSVSPPRFHLQDARLQVAGGQVSLNELAMDDGSIATTGSLSAFPLAYPLSFVKQKAVASTDLVIGADWNLKAAETIEGKMVIKRESGDVILDQDIALGLQQLEFSARAEQNRMQTALVLSGTRAGTVNASAELPLQRQDKQWRIAPAAALRATVDAAMPSIAWLSALAKPGSELDGALNLKATAQGSWNNPQISAQLEGDNLSGKAAQLALSKGQLRAALDAQSRPGSPSADVKLSLEASAPSYGNVSGEASATMTNDGSTWEIARAAPLQLDLNATIPSLAWANAFVKSEKAVFDGAVNFKASARGTFDHPQLSAELNGNGLSASLPQTEVALRDAQLRAQLSATAQPGTPHANVELSLNLSAPPYGNVSAEAQTRFSNDGKVWGIARTAPLKARVEAAVPSLEWTRALLPPGIAAGGNFALRAAADGTWENPGLSGALSGDALEVQHLDSGLNLKDGVLRAELKADSLLLKELTLHGGEGTLKADGSASLDGSNPVAKINFSADKLTAMGRPDRLLVLTGAGAFDLRDRKFSGDVKLKANRALIELPDSSGPSLGPDVVIAGETPPKPESAPGFSNANLVLDFDLGDNFVVVGKGLDAKLAGLITLRLDGAPPPTAKGTIRVTKGTYAAYGQRLVIDHGIVTFAGPIDNPGLDILAMRKNQPVEAGVAIAGTAQNPRLTLVSDPVVPDTEKVSWLVLGRGLSGNNQNDLALVQAAAGALLAKGQSVSLQTRIAQATGLDEVGISGSGLEGSVLTLGKRLSSGVYLTFERGLTGASNVAKLRYSLTPRWSLETQAGSDTALDLFYTLSFD